jgi:hypothetical protein
MYGLGLNGPMCLDLDKKKKKKKKLSPAPLGFFLVCHPFLFLKKKIRQITRHLSAQISVTIIVVGK